MQQLQSARRRSRSITTPSLLAISAAICVVSSSFFVRSVASLSAPAMKNVVVVGGGVQGTSVAYQLAQQAKSPLKITILESKEPASAASPAVAQ